MESFEWRFVDGDVDDEIPVRNRFVFLTFFFLFMNYIKSKTKKHFKNDRNHGHVSDKYRSKCFIKNKNLKNGRVLKWNIFNQFTSGIT